MTEEVHYPWERQDGESSRWFQRFEAFRLMGVSRSLLGAVNQEKDRNGQKRTKNASTSWRNACDTWNWRARAIAWDQYVIARTEAAIEERWHAEIMGRTETLGRMSEMGRVNIYDFVELGEDGHITGLKKEALEKFGYLVKKITSSEGKTNSIGIEMYGGQSAIEWIGKHLGLVNDRSTRMNVDLSNLTDEQLRRLSAGEDLLHVLATSG